MRKKQKNRAMKAFILQRALIFIENVGMMEEFKEEIHEDIFILPELVLDDEIKKGMFNILYPREKLKEYWKKERNSCLDELKKDKVWEVFIKDADN